MSQDIIKCQSCLTNNRISSYKTSSRPVCGKCKKPLPENIFNVIARKSIIIKSYIIKLYKGDVPLYITFFFYTFLGPSLFIFLLMFISKQLSSPILSHITVGILYLLMPYYIFMLIASWRSASKFTGNKYGGNIVKLIIILSILNIIKETFFYDIKVMDFIKKESSTKSENLPTNKLASEVARLLSKSTPLMIDSETELLRVSAVSNFLVYQTRYINLTGQDLDYNNIESSKEEIIALSSNQICTNPATLKYIQNGLILKQNLYTSDMKFILTFNIDKDKCNSLLFSNSGSVM
jgi:hypothetical protein